MFLDDRYIAGCTWQAFERSIERLLILDGYESVRLVGQSGDKGADVIARKFEKRWLIQVKHWNAKVGQATVQETLDAARLYRAQIPTIAASRGFDSTAIKRRAELQVAGIPLQLWDPAALRDKLARSQRRVGCPYALRPYQESAVQTVLEVYFEERVNRCLLVLATGLGKTIVAAEAIRRIRMRQPGRLLVVAHTNSLLLQLERAFWPFLGPNEATVIWNGYEKPTDDELLNTPFVFASVQSLASELDSAGALPRFDIALIDECHHAGSDTYQRVLDSLESESRASPFIIGLTATPWRADDRDLATRFGEPRAKVDLIDGMRNGYLSNVDYRMFTDNLRWETLKDLRGERLSPAGVNRTLFINEWDDAVVEQLAATWPEVERPRCIVFCGTIDHAITMRDRVNTLGFARAEAIYSENPRGPRQTPFERNRILADLADGSIGVVCTVDVLNEGIDVPDVNIVVFQRVTHSRRIFVQQLGRGLRLAAGKDKVVVLDFVSDIRRFAAGLALKDDLARPSDDRARRVTVNHSVQFQRRGAHDPRSESFLREWLEDVAAIEAAEVDASVLRFPPDLE